MSAAQFPSLVAASTRIEAGLGFINPENPGYRLCDAPRFVGCQMVAPERPFFQVIDRLDILV
jgi:hypothetical protein